MIKSEMPAKPPKEKRRNNEKRKEKSRDAARCRRSRETEIFSELAHSLPLPKDEVDQLDKASVMRLVISHLKVSSVMKLLPEIPIKIKAAEESSLEELPISKELSYLKALDGFVLVISPDGDLIYLSENVNEFLGVSQMDLMGQSVFEFSHPCDHEEIRDVLSVKSQEKDKAKSSAWETPKSFFIRMKCTLTSKGRNVNLKSASYKVIHCTGHILTQETCNMIESNNNDTIVKNESSGNIIIDCIKGKSSDDSMDTDSSVSEVKEFKPMKKMGSLVAIGRPIPHPSSIEVPLYNSTFVSKHSLDMKFTYADESMLDILGYDPQDLTGKSVYDYHHSIDSSALFHNFKCLFSKGQCETGRYRFLAKSGGYAWLITQATLMMDKQQKPLSVVCVNYVVSGVECRDEILSCSQARAAALQEQQRAAAPVSASVKTPAASPSAAAPAPIPAPVVAPIVHVLEGPQPATAKIFAPRTEEMNKGFLMFSEEEPGLTMLKEEPEDLTHLAPTAGDVCIPLEDSPFDMFDDFILGNDNYCGLLPEGFADLVGSGDSDDRTSCHLRADDDPFATPSYRDDDADSRSPLAMSPCVSKSSDVGSLPSLCSPGGSLPEEELNASPLLTELGLEGELDARAPYIPMGPLDQLPIHLGDHHNHRQNHLQQQQPPPLADGRVMWGALPDHLTLHMPRRGARTLPSSDRPVSNSNLARLLASPTTDRDADLGSKSPAGDVDVSPICINGVENSPIDTWRTDQRESLEPLPSKRQQTTNLGEIPTTVSSAVCDKTGSKRSASPAGVGINVVKKSRSRRQPQEKVSLQQPPPPPAGSVLMNLLVSGCDEKMPMAPPMQKQKEQLILDPMYHRPPLITMTTQPILEPQFLARYRNLSTPIKGEIIHLQPGVKAYPSSFANILQCETDPILSTAVIADHSPNAVGPVRKTSLDRLLDEDTSLFSEMSSRDWNMGDDELLQGSELLGTFDTPI